MSDNIKLVIEIPAELYSRIKDGGGWTCLNKCRECIENGIPLDSVKAEIEQNAYPIVHGVNNHEKGMTLYGILQVLDNIGKAESEE